MTARSLVKRALGGMPFAAEWFQSSLANGRLPAHGYRLDRLAAALPGWVHAATQARGAPNDQARRLLVFGFLPWWLEYAAALSTVLWAEGHTVDLAYLPYRNWTREVDRFDLRRQSRVLSAALRPLRKILELHDLAWSRPAPLTSDLLSSLESLSRTDAEYTLLREDVEDRPEGTGAPLVALRRSRNRAAAQAFLGLARVRRYDAVIVPNGSILEFGAVYRAARHLGLPVTTIEFGEQRGRMWIAQNDEVMRQDTSALWSARGRAPLQPSEARSLRALRRARQSGRTWGGFARRWQPGARRGSASVRRELGLGRGKPIALLCTNVVGDSLALGRQVFTRGMEDWLQQTVTHFARRVDAQLVIRVHPGEMVQVGRPSAEIVLAAVGPAPENIVVVPPDSPINTYDLIPLARLGLVYTSTAGLEMAMAGLPVIVAGQTHYRGKGFTTDPDSGSDYRAALEKLLARPRRLTAIQLARARRYAYRFFFEYPFPFPWHLVGFWQDQARHPLARIVPSRPRRRYRRTLQALTGKPIDWSAS